MQLISCPWCGDRDETEFSYGGQAHIAHPRDSEALDDAAWAQYVFFRDNPHGDWAERWYHSAGCRRWFNAIRNTQSHRILSTYVIGEPVRTSAAAD